MWLEYYLTLCLYLGILVSVIGGLVLTLGVGVLCLDYILHSLKIYQLFVKFMFNYYRKDKVGKENIKCK